MPLLTSKAPIWKTCPDVNAALLEKKDSDGAIAELREALRLKSSDAEGHFFLAGLLEQKGQLEEALEQYRAVHSRASACRIRVPVSLRKTFTSIERGGPGSTELTVSGKLSVPA
jgi:hypothetical protein